MKHYWLRTGFLWLAIAVASGQAWADDTAPAENPPAKAAARPSGPDMVTLNFVNADIEGVVKAVSEITRKNFVLDPRVKGTVSIVSARPMSRSQVYQVFLSSIRVQGFTAVEQRGMVLIVPEGDAKLYADSPDNARAAGDVVRTQVFRLQHESATQLVTVLRPLIAPNNSITANQSSNTLVVTDYASNLQRIEKIVASIDQPADSDSIMIPLKYASALDVAQTISRLLADPGQTADPTNRFTVAADARSNSLLARAGDPSRLRRVRELVAMLDTPTSASGNIHVIYLKNAQAVKLAEVLRAIHSGESSGAQLAAPAAAVPGQAPVAAQSGGMASGIIQADAATNSIIITAPDAIYNNLRAAVEKLDVRRAQVYIEALIAEVTSDKAAELGVQWQSLSGLGKNGTQAFGGTNFSNTGGNIIDLSGTAMKNGLSSSDVGNGLNIGVLRGTVTIPGTDIQILNLGALIHAVASDSSTNILSTPTLLTLDNEEAKIVVGQNVPFVTGNYTNTGAGTGVANPFQTVERKDVGLMLKIKPQISEGGVVRLQISEEVSSVQDLNKDGGGIITNKRSVDSTVLVDDGKIIVIGGLMQDSVTDGASKVPFLGDIPLLGNLFKSSKRERNKTNLMVFLRPTLLRSEESANSISGDRYDYILGEQAKAVPGSAILPDFGSPRLPPRPSLPAPKADKPATPQ
ncbi:General secretion pathway protein D / Type II secretion outermembrane pore forming protein (PulD) [Georgfuchsia toluolica]|uniref:General secretion pathway protein D / Type II secretion outermembrane pore forming protein (PulD) n=1 Tax=Georgfuchsia toluolica TaxID=424218 RepID=A0A916N036_9PROT|nr:type II secretion system secretin GspD [Georgfuchsia toluolica]CAG4883508.1 General secretion pathway protein D / Type II secretion outermembrane pore forming protein (PulD) [Georgfuchsia toluolica]